MKVIDLNDQQVIELKTRLTNRGLLDPKFDYNGNDPRKKITHNSNWYGLCTDAYLKFFEIFAASDKEPDGIPDKNSFDFFMSKSSDPAPIKASGIAKKITDFYEKNQWYISRGTDTFNVLFIEDITKDWKPHNGTLDKWDDLCVVWQCQHNGTANIIKVWDKVTTEPGRFYTVNPCNINGAARIAFGQYKAYMIGTHGSSRRTMHQGFREELPILVHRDLNKDGKRTGDKIQKGVFYCNWHSTIGGNLNSIGRWSAGCSVFQDMGNFKEFLNLLKTDRRYQHDNGYAFIGAYAAGDEIVQ